MVALRLEPTARLPGQLQAQVGWLQGVVAALKQAPESMPREQHPLLAREQRARLPDSAALAQASPRVPAKSVFLPGRCWAKAFQALDNPHPHPWDSDSTVRLILEFAH